MPEQDTGLLVNTSKGTVHRPDCEVVTHTNQRSGKWLAPWKGVAISPSDKACRFCLPDGLPPVPPAKPAVETATEWNIQCRGHDYPDWEPWARGAGAEAVQKALAEFRAASVYEWRAVRITTTTVVEDW